MELLYLFQGTKHLVKDPEIRCFENWFEAKSLAEEECLDPEYQVGIKIVEEHGQQIPDCIASIKRALVRDKTRAHVILTTTHKAKGMEWDSVMLGDDFPRLIDQKTNCLKPLGMDEGELNPEEVNLQYVAVTRARKNLQLNVEIKRVVANDYNSSPTQNR
jgi:superfamily I DNA/RNA helicase